MAPFDAARGGEGAVEDGDGLVEGGRGEGELGVHVEEPLEDDRAQFEEEGGGGVQGLVGFGGQGGREGDEVVVDGERGGGGRGGVGRGGVEFDFFQRGGRVGEQWAGAGVCVGDVGAEDTLGGFWSLDEHI